MSDQTMGIIELVFSFGLVLGLIALDLWFMNREEARDRKRKQEAQADPDHRDTDRNG
jgi:hypothetical protein